MTTIDISDDLAGGSSAYFRFSEPGDKVKGEILSARKEQETVFGTDEPATYKSGKPRMMWVVKLQTELRDPDNPDDDGTRDVYLKGAAFIPGSAYKGFVEAVSKHGKAIDIGATLAVQFTGYGEPHAPGMNPPKQFAVAYKPPAPGVDLDDLLG